jgi:hypothetical protein
VAGLLIFAVLIGLSFAYYWIKQNVKRNIFFKDQYERQKTLTHRNLVLDTAASMQTVQNSLAQHLPDDSTARAAFSGGAMRVRMEHPERIVYHHTSKFFTGGSGDEFTASVTFKPLETGHLRAVVSIDRWREKDGVTRRAGISAMENFMGTVVNAFRAVDPAVQVHS